MWFVWRVLSIGKLASTDPSSYYIEALATGTEDYYLSAGEQPGRWVGRGAAQLGLSGVVEAGALRAVLSGIDATSGATLAHRARGVPGFDLTYSAPKSVSLLYALGDPSTVTAVIDAHDRAVDAALAYLERWACQVRRGHAGAVLEPGRGFVAGAFRHRTSREGDPNLHTHVVVANAVRAADGRWSAPDARALYRNAKAAGAVYQAVLRRHLYEALGIGFVAHQNGNALAEVAGVPRWAVEAFSTRRRQITAALAEQGVTGRTAAQVANLVTRRPKGAAAADAELREAWATTAADIGFDLDMIELDHHPTDDVGSDDVAMADRLTSDRATFTRRDAVVAAAAAAMSGATHDEIEQRVDGLLESEAVIAAGIPSNTIARLLADLDAGHDHLDARTVVVIDEASMVGTKQLAALTHHAARAGAKLVLIGDPKQLPEIEAGGLFAALTRRLPALRLDENRRQRDPVERRALDELRSGAVDEALNRLAEYGRITVDDNADRLRDRMVTEAIAAMTAGQSVLMLTYRRADAADLNGRARQALAAAGHLGEVVATVGDLHFAKADRVLALRNDRLIGVHNGDSGTVVGSACKGLTVALDRGTTVTMPPTYLAAGHLVYGYASTIHKAQGATADVCVVLGDEALYAEAGYTALTRGRQRNHLYTVAASATPGLDRSDRAAAPVAGIRRGLGTTKAQTAAVDLA